MFDSRHAFEAVTGYPPYPWQARALEQFEAGNYPTTFDIPTGLGKTTVVLCWLLALVGRPALPRRTIYVVDRRAIVDQTAATIQRWVGRLGNVPEIADTFHRMATLPAVAPVSLGVLRGGLADDGEWRLDPSRPAVIIGTVDMVGSRLLFSGYGDGMSRRSMHAGLLAHDAVVMLDEAHLSTAFADLLADVERLQHEEGGGFRRITLSATGRTTADPFRLDEADLEEPAVARRLGATKRLTLHEVDKPGSVVTKIVEQALALGPGSVAVFVRSPKAAAKVAQQLRKQVEGDAAERVALLTGTLRGHERSLLSETDVWARFTPDRSRDPVDDTVYLVMTSAGEVGVDLDADHCVMDATTLDSVIQRVGRVNRNGLGDADVHVVHTESEAEGPGSDKTESKPRAAALAACLETLATLPDLSPQTLRCIDPDALAAASAPRPTSAPLHRETVEALSATSADIPLPPAATFLRGIATEPEEPDTYLVWRWDVDHLVACGSASAADALAFFRPAPVEIARVSLRDAGKIIEEAIKRRETSLSVIVRDAAGRTRAHRLRPGDPLPALAYATVVLPADAGGLDPSGLPADNAKAEVSDVADDATRRRRLTTEGETDAEPWHGATRFAVPLPTLDDEDDQPRRSLVYEFRRIPAAADSDSDVTRLATADQTVAEHNRRVGEVAERFARALDLPEDVVAALGAAGRSHDTGKARRVWQSAAGFSSTSEPMAKSRSGSMNVTRLGGFRQEFASLADAERQLPADTPERDLVLHLIAAHHGRGRPGFADPSHWDPDMPDAANRKLATDTANRFGRLQARFGPWRLAWLEAILKAADAVVSSGRDEATP